MLCVRNVNLKKKIHLSMGSLGKKMTSNCLKLTMFLTSTNILGPITGMSLFVVQETADAKLFSSSTIPTSPITSTRSFVSKYAIKPVTVFGTDGGI